MCGIAGIIHLKKAETTTAAQVMTMLNRLQHRGADGEGIVCFEGDKAITAAQTAFLPAAPTANYHPRQTAETLYGQRFSVALGHRRLSIIDPTPQGHQPMASADARFWLTFNGEIYNYVELRATLEMRGHQFRTATDTEVVLAAYREYGTDCLAYFNGMFAFVLYDLAERRVFIARDRTGVKPFYYVRTADTFAFASEQKALLSLPFVEKKLNYAAVFDYFILGAIEAQTEGLFAGIMELPSAHFLIFDLKNTPQANDFLPKKYFELPKKTPFEPFSAAKFEVHRLKTKALVQDAIRLRLRADVPIGSCLSGGIDSSTVVCTINELLQQRDYAQIGAQQKVFTSCFEDARYDEQRWAAAVVQQTGAEWHKTFPSRSDFVRDLETMIYAQDIPMFSSSTYAQFRVMQAVAEQGVKVVLDGQGADELFGGYLPHYIGIWSELLQHLSFVELVRELKATDKLSNAVRFWLKSLVKHHLVPSMPKHWQHQFQQRYFQDLKYLNKTWVVENLHRYNEYAEQRLSSLSEMLHEEFFGHRLKQLLKCEDRSSMWFGIESRTPFADDLPLMQHAFGVSSSYKIHGGVRKYLLREAFRDVLPPLVYGRQDKMGFVTPTNRWMAEMRPAIRPYFEEYSGEVFNKTLLLRDFDAFFSPATELENYRIFKFISFVVWEKVFFGK